MGFAAGSDAPSGTPAASLARCTLSLGYEALLLLALLFAASLPFVMIAHAADSLAARPAFQFFLIAVAGTYFVWQWRRGGQTLAMKTWRIRLVTREGAPLSLRHAAVRFLFAVPGALLLGTGFLWALVDREGLSLHDRLAGTKIVRDDS